MVLEKLESKPNANRYMQLNNRAAGPTFPISVDYTFLSDLLNLEKSYANDKTIMFRGNSHPLRMFHVTSMSIRLMMTIFRRFNTEGTLVGMPIHRLYCLMNEEYEDMASKEQFYAEVHKFIQLGLLSITRDGIVYEWKIESFKRDTGRFVLFNPLVFKDSFTSLELGAQKLYLYIVSRNGDKVNAEFKEFIGPNSWIYTLTHKSRPAQVRELLNSLAALEPVAGQPLLLKSTVEKDSLGRWSVSCVVNPAYLIKHIEGAQYRLVPPAKIPYSKTVSRLRILLRYHKIAEIVDYENGKLFLRLAKLLHNASLKTLRFAVTRIKEMLTNSGFTIMGDIVHSLQTEIQDRAFIIFMDIAKETGIYRYLGMGEEGSLDDVRPLQFYRAIKDTFNVKEFKKQCLRAMPILRKRYGDELRSNIIQMHRPPRSELAIHYETFFLEDFLMDLFQQNQKALLA
ncbi:hypothetical protein [Paenibacillus agricola]|uniref:Replication initiator protein A n=1 Tax=Paenibacillus agricola TaxID=2716264 RepID=A0ABX0JC61_9BACL|nr:hypothetical protein [Paenibacillus agricola]NHN33153.1 hypothetical protein [Paenibacillus agricola]